MTLLVVVGKSDDATPDTVSRDAARVRELAKLVDDLIVVEADGSGEGPTGAHTTSFSPQLPASTFDPRRSSLSVVLADAARHDPGTVLLLLDTDARQVERVHPLARKLEVPVLWWRESEPKPHMVAAVEDALAGLLTWDGPGPTPGWAVGAGIDVQSIPLIEALPARPPLRVLAWTPTGDAELTVLLGALAFARGLTIDAHLTIALTSETAAEGLRHRVEAHAANLALTRSVHVSVVAGLPDLPHLLAETHAFVDVGEPEGGIPLAPLLGMAHGRVVLSSRDELAGLIESSPLPLRFTHGDALDLADRMRSLAAAWSSELGDVGQTLRDAVRVEHSVTHWAETVVSIVGFVRSGGTPADESREAERHEDDGGERSDGRNGDVPKGSSQPGAATTPDQAAPDAVMSENADEPISGDNGAEPDSTEVPRRRWFRRSTTEGITAPD